VLTALEAHREQRRRKAISGTGVASGNASAFSIALCPQRGASQIALMERMPSERMLPSVIGSIGFPSLSRALRCVISDEKQIRPIYSSGGEPHGRY
jgi:hypothetical protein